MVQCVSSHAEMLRIRTLGLEVFERLLFFAAGAGPALQKGLAFKAHVSIIPLCDLIRAVVFELVALRTRYGFQ